MYYNKVFSDNKEVMASGTVIAFNNKPITIRVFDDAEQVVVLRFCFEKDADSKEARMLTSVNNETLTFTLVNCTSPLPTGTLEPIDFATYKGKKLFIHLRATALGDSDTTLYYSIYMQDGDENA